MWYTRGSTNQSMINGCYRGSFFQRVDLRSVVVPTTSHITQVKEKNLYNREMGVSPAQTTS